MIMSIELFNLCCTIVKVKLKLKLTGVGDIFLASVRKNSSW